MKNASSLLVSAGVLMMAIVGNVRAQASIRVEESYEDSVRIVILWNHSGRTFSDFPDGYNVGHQTRDFVVQALDTTRMGEVVVLPTPSTTWGQIRDLWPGELPHVIVHVNSGYQSKSGPHIGTIMDSAVANHIGVVSIGDDAAAFGSETFGLTGVENVPEPMRGAQGIDSLWLGLNRAQDDRLKDRNVFPWVNGVISNAVDSLGTGDHLVFKPYCTNSSETCRNESDADEYTALYPNWLTFLGYQRGWDNGGYVADVGELSVIVAIQDTIYNDPSDSSDLTVRRGVALSYQPQYLVNSEASQQIVYDAILFSSLAHKLGAIVKRVELNAEPSPSTIAAGESVEFTATVYLDSIDQHGVRHEFTDAMRNNEVTWQVLGHPENPGLRVHEGVGSATNTFYGERAHQTYTVIATYVDEYGNVESSELVVTVTPGPAHHIVIEATPDSAGKASSDSPRDLLTLGPNDESSEEFYAIARDEYQNWIGPASPANWSSANNDIVTAQQGSRPARGQGRVTRVTENADSAVITATYVTPGSGTTLTDDMLVRLERAHYTDIRIGTRLDNNFTPAITVEMTTVDDTTLWVQGRRSDNGQWEYIDASWTADILLSPSSAEGSSWEFTPDSVGEGWITAATTITEDGSTLSTRVRLVVTRGGPDQMRLYAAPGDPSGITPLAASINVTAGENKNLVAKLFDQTGLWLSEYEQDAALKRLIAWELSDGGDGATLTPDSNFQATFRSTQAHRSYTVTARFTHGGAALNRTITIYVRPSAASQLFVEATSARDVSPNSPNPLDTVTITSEDTTKLVYAVLRDEFGNWVSPCDFTLWTSADSSVATARAARIDAGEGVVTRSMTVTDGSVFIRAEDGNRGFKDSTLVVILPYYYTDLRIYVRTAGGMQQPTELTMNTNQDTTLYVQGRRSDNPSVWEDVSALWEHAESLNDAITSPGETNDWFVSPVDTGTGWIRVGKGDPARTTPDSIQVHFTPGPPTRVDISILTPANQLIAGEPIQARVRIFNDDGELVPGPWCGDAVFGDILDSLDPKVIIGGDTIDFGDTREFCFNGGADTVTFLIYYAPQSRDPHRIGLTLGSLVDSTERFILLPGELARLEIVDANGVPVTDTVRLSAPNGAAVFAARGYDRWGNPRGSEMANWSTTNTLHAPTRTDSTWRIFYETSQVIDAESGWMRAAGVADGSVADSVYVTIKEPPTRLVYALTLDTNANGYLDGLELHFLREVALPTDPAALNEFLGTLVVEGPDGTMLSPVSIIGANGTLSDSVFVVSLREQTSEQQPQTAWRPQVSFSGLPDVTDANQIQAVDGAGPVVWKVTKYVGEGENPTIEVVFSEPVQDTLGSSLSPQMLVEELLNVYSYNEATDTYELIDGVLEGITVLSIEGNQTLIFEMDNGQDLVPGHYVNLRMHVRGSGAEDDTFFVVTDRALTPGHAPNEPSPENRKVQVELRGNLPLDAVPVPNPGRPSTHYVPAGELDAVHHETVRHDLEDVFPPVVRGGVNTKVTITRPEEKPDGTYYAVRAYRRIYDIAGNLVNSGHCDDIMKAYLDALDAHGRVDRPSTELTLYFHWNGFNAQGKPVAPGVYREVLYLDYEAPASKDERKILTYGMKR